MAKRKPMQFPNIEGAGMDQYWVYIAPSTAYLYSISPGSVHNRRIGTVYLTEDGEVKYTLDEYVNPNLVYLDRVIQTVKQNVANAIAKRMTREVT